MAQNSEIFRDIDLVQRCLEGDQDAVLEAGELHLPFLKGLLAQRGASEGEINELVGTVWGDCLVSDGIHPPLFQKFDGKSPLRPWLTAITVNRWLSSKRREQARKGAIERLRLSQGDGAFTETPSDSICDWGLVEIVGKAIRNAFSEGDAEGLVMLRLIHIHGLSRKEVATLWACHESTICRRLADTEAQVDDSIRREIRQMDPFLELQWEDLLLFSESTHFILR
jgi:DNA-directed RNA polymerase specialized sigma24 family protein